MDPSAAQIRKLVAKLLAAFTVTVVAFSSVYWILECQFGHELGPTLPGAKFSYWDCIYLSAITITTLGYGDVVPLGVARIFASIEAIFGLAFTGYAIAVVVSTRQDALVDYLAKDRIVQTYDQCLAMIMDAKELLGDRRRSMKARMPVAPIDFIYNRANPFYPALRAMETLNGYTAHIEEIQRARFLTVRVERAAHHVEELASFTRKYAKLLQAAKVPWRTRRTRYILSKLCDEIEAFSISHIIHTRYDVQEYKGGGVYRDIVQRLTTEIRTNIEDSGL